MAGERSTYEGDEGDTGEGARAGLVLGFEAVELYGGCDPGGAGRGDRGQRGQVGCLAVLLVVIGSIAIQAGTNLMNDYYDYKKGADGPGKLGMGGSIQRGDLKPRQIFVGGMLAFGIGIAIGLYLVWVSGPFILWLGLLSVAAGFFYTAGPFALAYVGLGEVAVFIFMGPVMVVGSIMCRRGR